MTVPGGRQAVTFDPEQALRTGRFDAAALLIVGLFRGAVPLLIVIGLSYATLTIGPHFEALPPVNSAGAAFRALLSPFALVAAAVLIRICTGIVALLIAYPISRRATGSTIGPDLIKRLLRVWQDRLHLVRAYRSMRWTSPVRTLAIHRLGRTGYFLSWVGTGITILFWISIAALLVLIALQRN